jgi:hypothetical protein
MVGRKAHAGPAVALCRGGLDFLASDRRDEERRFVYASVRSCTIEICMKLTTLESALGQKQTLTFKFDDARFTSKADIEATQTDVRFVPIADIWTAIRSPRRRGRVPRAELQGPSPWRF